MDLDAAAALAAKAKESVREESGRVLAEIDAYAALATGNPYATHDDIQEAIEASRAAQDAVSEIKSAAIIGIDNGVKEIS
ncbi:hypothetical protein A2Z10_03545 [Candidatus Azambacteria bacterium RBG_16_47_10]|uniref:Uncharacterized protein n=1 Tax=Candidatus Azambacteria bacterium RBG_16_47_10 TaxID=1797292 RepID=A0A1F5AXX1_9BACT|nr:MAG: hypothetical protein A2Z10_03545 [Candidatus Azambacteria bacterium RBG_16_47_10]